MTKPRLIDPIRIALGPSALLILAGACGSSAPTQQLVDARNTYQMAQASGTAQMAPNRMEDAQDALDKAERAHKDEAGSTKEANLAYVAERKARIAMASGKAVAAMQRERQFNAQYQAKLESMSKSQQAQLQGQEAMQQTAEEQRAAAEARAHNAEMLSKLGGVANVRQGENGTIVTLSGGLLFPTAGDTLSEEAHQSLDQIAEVLVKQPLGTQIRIEGFTDASGSTTFNEALSQRRADAVRDYLAQRGVESAMLDSIGRGEADPVASNDTADGREKNRRAEIVIELPKAEGMPSKSKPGRPDSSAKPLEEKPEQQLQLQPTPEQQLEQKHNPEQQMQQQEKPEQPY